jgi:hypothetical protein
LANIGNARNLVGRPKKYDDHLGSGVVKRRNITVTDPGWQGLDVIVAANNLSSRSELVEQIGRNNLVVSPKKQELISVFSEEIPVLRRLLSLTRKMTYMRSFISFSRLILLRIGISKKIDFNDDELIEEVIIEAITFIALRDYIYPDHLVDSVLADTRWLIFTLLLLKSHITLAAVPSKKNETLEGNQNIVLGNELKRIFNSIYHFSISFPQEYQIYEMRMLESLTWEQIHRVLKIRDVSATREEIMNMNHKSVDKIREAWHYIDIGISTEKNENSDLKKQMNSALISAQKYYELINDESLFAIEQFANWEMFILQSAREPKLDLLLPEIHHSWIHEKLVDSNDMKIYKDKSSKIVHNINERFEQHLIFQLNSLKQKIRFCGNKKKDIQDVLIGFIPPGISEIHFLGDRINR